MNIIKYKSPLAYLIHKNQLMYKIMTKIQYKNWMTIFKPLGIFNIWQILMTKL